MKKSFFAAAITVSAALSGCASTGGGMMDQIAKIPVVGEMTGISKLQRASHVLQLAKNPAHLSLDGTLQVPVTVEKVEIIEVEAGNSNTFAAYGETARGINETYRKVGTTHDPVAVNENADSIDTAITVGTAVLGYFGKGEMIETQRYTLVTDDGYRFTMDQPADTKDVFAEGDSLIYRSADTVDAEANLFYVERANKLASK